MKRPERAKRTALCRQSRHVAVSRAIESFALEALHLVLASASPRRAELLHAAAIAFETVPAHIDESVYEGESPESYVRRVAEDKARAVHAQRPGQIVLAADTTVVVDGLILGKPADADDARRMLRLLSGRAHRVITGVTLVGPGDPGPDTRAESTAVTFAALSSAEIEWYVATAEPMDKAGAYAIQGGASRFITRIDGSYSNVVGLPVALVWEMLARFRGTAELPAGISDPPTGFTARRVD